jgi:hypothetical protein
MEDHWKFRGVGGSQQPKFENKRMELNRNFWIGGDAN